VLDDGRGLDPGAPGDGVGLRGMRERALLSEQYLYEALRAGASGYVLKSVVDRDLVEACRATMSATARTSSRSSG
jgi:hypothetical protein